MTEELCRDHDCHEQGMCTNPDGCILNNKKPDRIIKQEQLQLTGGNHKGTRRALDDYPTPTPVTVALMDFLYKERILDTSMVVREPACGERLAMAYVIASYGNRVISTDIVLGQDYMKHSLYDEINVDAVITNPPFSVADKFIKKALTQAPIVAMLLKSQYFHAAKRYEMYQKNPPAWILPLTWRPDFEEHLKKKKGSPTMEVIWFLWIRGDHSARYQPLLKQLSNEQVSRQQPEQQSLLFQGQ